MQVSDWITLLGIVVTGYFSYWIMRFTKEAAQATKESAVAAQESARAANASFELTKLIQNREEQKEVEFREALKREYKRALFEDIQRVRKAVFSQNITLDGKAEVDYESVRNAPRECCLTDEQLAIYFEPDEIEKIRRVWTTFHYWLENYWNDSMDKEQEFMAAARVDQPRIAIYDVEKIFN